MELPTIVFSGAGGELLRPGSDARGRVAAEVRGALERYGCFEAVFDRSPAESRRSFFAALPELFDLPIDVKRRNASPIPSHGYMGQIPLLPLYESLGIGDAGSPAKVRDFTTLLWPEGNPNFSEIANAIMEQVSQLDQLVRELVIESYGLDDRKLVDEHLESTNYLLRMMKYGKADANGEVEQMGLGAHQDMNVITILFQNNISGLEIKTEDGRWIPALTTPDSFTVMAGETLMGWSNGRITAPYHRVTMREGTADRYSVAVFSLPRPGFVYKPPEELVDDDHPLQYNPFDAFEYMLYCAKETGQITKSDLKDFCGTNKEMPTA